MRKLFLPIGIFLFFSVILLLATRLSFAQPLLLVPKQAVGAAHSAVSQDIAPHAGGKISGVITAADGLTPILASAQLWFWDGATWLPRSTYLTNEDGRYQIINLQPGRYRVEFIGYHYITKYYDNATSFETAQDIIVNEESNITGINASLHKYPRISGRVTSQSDGSPISGAVYIHGLIDGIWQSYIHDQTNIYGIYDISVPSGEYRLEFVDISMKHLSEYYVDATTLEAATSIIVEPDDVITGIDAALQEGGHITGKVTGPYGVIPATNVLVTVFDFSPGYWRIWRSYDADGLGVYDAYGLPTGAYRIQFSDKQAMLRGEYYPDAETIDSAQSISVTVGQTMSGIDASLHPIAGYHLLWLPSSLRTYRSPGRIVWTWSPITQESAPAGRRGHAAVWTGTEMIVWGGDSALPPGTGTRDGGRYDPSTDTWRSMSTIGAPISYGRDTRAVWTGSEMIVFGDARAKRYAPATDTWQPVSAIGALPSRRNSTMVWTGSEVVTWGGWTYDSGLNETVYLGDGARYNPATDTWALLPEEGAPSPRSHHSAVWTGEEMIIWGGNRTEPFQPVTLLGDGARYNPSTNLWRPMSSVGAPSGRYLHTAVWTGTEMIIWGGFSTEYLNSGAKYNPITDTWTPLPAQHAPGARAAHTAIWTGSEMLIWGGSVDSNLGGSYDPRSDRWSTLPATGAPGPRSEHSAVWSGSEMLVWGGYYGPPPFLQSGGRLKN